MMSKIKYTQGISLSGIDVIRIMIVTTYNINLNLNIRVALVADLHEMNPDDTLRALRDVAPDAILIAGDLWERQEYDEFSEWNHQTMSELQTGNRFQQCCYYFTQFISGNMFNKGVDKRSDEEKDYSNRFLRMASCIAPVFLSTGNHEWYYTDEDYALIKQTETTLLDNGHVYADIKGNSVLIGGLSTRVNLAWLDEFLSLEAEHKILLCHHPEYVPRYIEGRGKVDLIVSGHAHGGQWRILGRIPVYAPGQGLFPKYTRGVYDTETGPMVVSTGCSNHVKYPRWGNPCELVVLNL